jgi:uncharacterized coiled-coil protein SlyX
MHVQDGLLFSTPKCQRPPKGHFQGFLQGHFQGPLKDTTSSRSSRGYFFFPHSSPQSAQGERKKKKKKKKKQKKNTKTTHQKKKKKKKKKKKSLSKLGEMVWPVLNERAWINIPSVILETFSALQTHVKDEVAAVVLEQQATITTLQRALLEQRNALRVLSDHHHALTARVDSEAEQNRLVRARGWEGKKRKKFSLGNVA